MKRYEEMNQLEAEVWGYIPEFLSSSDPAPAKEQFDRNYVSGWHAFKGFQLDHANMMLKYPDDPSMLPISVMQFREEHIFLYPHAWVLILQPDGLWTVARMD